MKQQELNTWQYARHTTKYRLRFDGGFIGMLAITVAAFSLIFLPVALIMLITSIEVDKYEQRGPGA